MSVSTIKVLLLSKYGTKGASSRVRSLQYLKYLEKQNFNITTAELFSNEYLEILYKTGRNDKKIILLSYFKRLYILLIAVIGRKYDILWIEKELFPWTPFFFESIFYRLGIKVFVDYDDPVFHSYDKHHSVLVKRLLGNKIPQIMKRSSFVSVSSHYMKDFAISSGANNVEVIPPSVSPTDFRVKVKSIKDKKCIIGWIGSPSATKYLFSIEEALHHIYIKHNVEFVLIGASSDIPKNIPFKQIEWTQQSEVEQMENFDVGIMPLSDDYFSIARDHYKLVKYMSASIPFVSSPMRESILNTQQGVNGFIAHNISEWITYLSLLIEDYQLRMAMGERGYNIAKEQNCTSEVQKKIALIFNKLIINNVKK
jgi:hypothetical protein